MVSRAWTDGSRSGRRPPGRRAIRPNRLSRG